jgi:probable F420-dependent oxidoreductase
MAMTLQRLSEGRFVLGLGRSVGPIWSAMGLPAPTTASMADIARILRRLWAGETLSYRGPAGTFPRLNVARHPDVDPPPLVVAAMGPRTLAMAGEVYDGVLLHPFLTTDAISQAIGTVREAAGRSGRDPSSVRIYAAVVTAPSLPADEERAVVGARALTYLQAPGFGDLLVRLNGWDTSVLGRLRSHLSLSAAGAETSRHATEQGGPAEAAALIPSEWIRASAAVGTPAACARRLKAYLDVGVDEVVLHGTNPSALGTTISEFRTPSDDELSRTRGSAKAAARSRHADRHQPID